MSNFVIHPENSSYGLVSREFFQNISSFCKNLNKDLAKPNTLYSLPQNDIYQDAIPDILYADSENELGFDFDLNSLKPTTETQVVFVLRLFNIEKYSIVHGNTYGHEQGFIVNVKESVNLLDQSAHIRHYTEHSSLNSLIINFGRIEGDFNCSSLGLDTLKGAPHYVGGDFNCDYNSLKSLEYCPSEVRGDFSCRDNEIISFDKCYLGTFAQEYSLFQCDGNPRNGDLSKENLIKHLMGINGVDGQWYYDMLDKYIDFHGKIMINGIEYY